MKKTRAKHSKEFKVSTIRMMESKGMSARDVEESLNRPAHTYSPMASSNQRRRATSILITNTI